MRGTPWVGTFLMKDAGAKSKDRVVFPGSDAQAKTEDEPHGEELYKSLHEYGTFAQVLWSVLDSLHCCLVIPSDYDYPINSIA